MKLSSRSLSQTLHELILLVLPPNPSGVGLVKSLPFFFWMIFTGVLCGCLLCFLLGVVELLFVDCVDLLTLTKALLDEDSGLDTLTGSLPAGLLGLRRWFRGHVHM